MTDQDPQHEPAAPRRPRWWPGFIIVVLIAALVAYIWRSATVPRQERVMTSIMVGLVGAALLLVWIMLFSRLRWRTRWMVFAAAAILACGGGALFEVKGVTGDLVPIIGLRWGSTPAATVSGPAELVATIDLDALTVLPGSADWPQFLGPERYPAVESIRIDPDWDAHAPRELWRIDVGQGWSAFAVAGPIAVTQEQRGERELVTAYELATGKPLWTHADDAWYGEDGVQATIAGVGPRATPTIADGRVYTMGSTGILNCLELTSGRVLWRHDLLAEHGGVQLEWGMPASPLVHDGTVIVHFDRAEGPTLAAYDAESGEPVWEADTDQRAAYGTPMIATLDGVEQIVMFNLHTVTGHEPATGRTLWEAAFNSAMQPKVAMPLVVGHDRLFVSAGYGVGAVMYRINRSESGEWAVAEDYLSRRMSAKFANMVMDSAGQYVFGLDDGILACVDLADGRRVWKGGRYGHGQLIRVGDHLLVTTELGDLVLLEASTASHIELHTLHVFDAKTWNPPALAGRYLLMRNDREAVCLELPVVE